MSLQSILDHHDFILTEAAVIESLRRSDGVQLHPRLENAPLIYDEDGRDALAALYQSFIHVARKADVPILICAPTWRANRERMVETQCTTDLNADAVRFLRQLRDGCGTWAPNLLIGGMVGCKNDCYKPEEGLDRSDAKAFHGWQIEQFADAGADFLLAATLPALSEATGIALAMAESDSPYIISFVIDRSGRVLDGNSLERCFGEIDAACSRPPIGYMINCAYPSFLNAQHQPEAVLSRLIAYQANASSLDHSELDDSETLHADEISDWGDVMVELNRRYGIKILGGCCGTSVEHLHYIIERIVGQSPT